MIMKILVSPMIPLMLNTDVIKFYVLILALIQANADI